jgi:threonine synthase
MGVGITKFRVATNQNDVLHRLFATGEYSLGRVEPSLAPSMDIQVASNFERLLFYFLDGDPQKVVEVMQSFRATGKYSFDKFDLPGFSSVSASDEEISELIREIQEKYDYLVDPHTACAFKDLETANNAVILGTAHPAKFPSVYEKAGMVVPVSPILEELKTREPMSYEISVDPESIRSFIVEKLGRS